VATKSIYAPLVRTPDRRDREDPGVLEIHGDEHRHLAVSRTRPGEEVEVFDGEGRVWPGVVLDRGRERTRVRVGPMRLVRRPKAEIILAQALIRNAALDQILEKAVELGATRIVPFRAERSIPTGQDREIRWQRILVAATKQSKRYHVPRLDPIARLGDVLAMDAASRIVLSERGGARLGSALSGAPVLCLVGPEGGWSEAELAAVGSAGFRDVHLVDGILRAETAAALAVGLVAYELGDM
jgi:16S rRNA (uracil1498-N3)-methyltransferase